MICLVQIHRFDCLTQFNRSNKIYKVVIIFQGTDFDFRDFTLPSQTQASQIEHASMHKSGGKHQVGRIAIHLSHLLYCNCHLVILVAGDWA